MIYNYCQMQVIYAIFNMMPFIIIVLPPENFQNFKIIVPQFFFMQIINFLCEHIHY